MIQGKPHQCKSCSSQLEGSLLTLWSRGSDAGERLACLLPNGCKCVVHPLNIPPPPVLQQGRRSRPRMTCPPLLSPLGTFRNYTDVAIKSSLSRRRHCYAHMGTLALSDARAHTHILVNGGMCMRGWVCGGGAEGGVFQTYWSE